MWPPAFSVFSAFFACAFVGRDDSARRSSFFVGIFRRLRAASDFPNDGKVTKGSPGDGSRWTLRAHIRLTPKPPLRGSPLHMDEKFPARGNLCAWVWSLPGLPRPWVGEKFSILRSHSCACVFRTDVLWCFCLPRDGGNASRRGVDGVTRMYACPHRPTIRNFSIVV